jgi:hypothetical protein
MNAESECQPIEFDLFQVMRRSCVEQDGNSKRQQDKII